MMPTTKAPKVKRVKGGKGKKNDKRDSKTEKESDVETVRVNAALWELRLKSTNQELSQYQKDYFNLAQVNEQVRNQLRRAEEDSIQLTGLWEKRNEDREDKIRELEENLKKQMALALEERNKAAQDFNMIQIETRKLKDTNAHMELELSVMRDKMEIDDKEYRDNLVKLEKNFLKEKATLQMELKKQHSQEIETLKLAHLRNVALVKDALHSTFEEQRIRLNQTLENTKQEAEDLKKLVHSVYKKNLTLTLQKDEHEQTIKNTTAKMQDLKKRISELVAKNASLQKTLEQSKATLEQQEQKEKMHLVTIQASQVELDKLQQVLIMREEEMKKVKQLASVILKERGEVQTFFLEALDHVRNEIEASRLHYKKEAFRDYQQKMREATAGKIKFPPIRTFNKNPNSTNSVYADVEAAAKWSYPPGSEVDFSELNWEQKEQVLSLLFVKMNGYADRKHQGHLATCTSCEKQKSHS